MPLVYWAPAAQCEKDPDWSLVYAPPFQFPTLIEPYGPRASALTLNEIATIRTATALFHKPTPTN